ncbi:MAG TPA: protein-L-isoaspartate(D-aspartate) O-methyltransferase [Verrucomicrobiales bacterium]|nr:protein-L-isoaspartate(D-aspartate) O-methyltransferase [Verrucomicrobiales bacterium]
MNGDTFQAARDQMVERQLQSPGRDIRDTKVLEAMRRTPRHRFVPESQRDLAYTDSPLPIGYGQTISQPYIVALMTEQLRPEPGDKILEIGTGSGYQAAVLASLVREVYSVEIVPELAEQAKTVLEELGYENVRVRSGDGYLGWEEAAPFDAIVVTCAPDHVPPALIAQLAEGGRMMIPVGPDGGVQELYLLTKNAGQLNRRAVLPVRFVPMTGTPDTAPQGRENRR